MCHVFQINDFQMCPPDDNKHSFSITSSFGLQKERDIFDDDTEELDDSY